MLDHFSQSCYNAPIGDEGEQSPSAARATREGGPQAGSRPGRAGAIRSGAAELNHSVGAAVARVKGIEGGIFKDTAEIGWYSVRLSRPMAVLRSGAVFFMTEKRVQITEYREQIE